MNNEQDNSIRRVYELASRLLEVGYEPAEERELISLLENNPVARRAYLEYIQESAALKWAFADSFHHRRAESSGKSGVILGWGGAISICLSLAALLLVGFFYWDMFPGREQLAHQHSSHQSAGDDPAGAQDADGNRKEANDHPSSGVAILSYFSDVEWCDTRNPPRELSRIDVGQRLCFKSGRIELVYDAGAEVFLTGPCDYEIRSPVESFCRQGSITARVKNPDCGFTIHTPYAQVIDLGTAFGLQVDEEGGSADVVVFEGVVDLTYPSKESNRPRETQRLYMGEGAQVDSAGTLSRIVSISAGQFGSLSRNANVSAQRSALISSVRDNIDRLDSLKFYEIVPGGMCEEALAYVDRPAHAWNGVTEEGMPPYLIGGDYVKFFNDDKILDDVHVWVTVAKPAILFVLFDDRIPSPEWLKSQFVDTGDDIGLDMGTYTQTGKSYPHNHKIGKGPGKCIDNVLSVWRREVKGPEEILLGATGVHVWDAAMYGIVAVPTKGE